MLAACMMLRPQQVDYAIRPIPPELHVEVSSIAVAHYFNALVQDSPTSFKIYLGIAPDVPWALFSARLPTIPNVAFLEIERGINNARLKELQDESGDTFVRLFLLTVSRWDPNCIHMKVAYIASSYGQIFREYTLERVNGRWLITKDIITGVI